MSFIEIDPFLTKEEIEYFKSFAEQDGWQGHKSTVSGRSTGLQYRGVQFRGKLTMLSKLDPNVKLDWHTDGINLGRHTTLLHPVTDDYAPFMCEDGQTTKPALVNTQARHAVFNNNNIRLNLQIPFSVDFEEVKADSDHWVWKEIEKLYEL